jgi:16S rRNA (uracil1498-N3)-methyltransferase
MQASKQCKRDFICRVESPIDIFSIEISKFDIFYLPYERKEKKKPEGMDIPGRLSDYFKKIKSGKAGSNSGGSSSSISHITGSIGYIIGPEGGFEEEEVDFLKRNEAAVVYLGKNILRSETAAIYFLSVLDYSLKRYKRD